MRRRVATTLDLKRKYRIKPPSPFRRFNSSSKAIHLLVMIYVKYLLSLQNVEDLLLERGSDLCHATVWHWWTRFGRLFAAEHPAPAREPDEELPPVTLAPRQNVREAGRRDGLPVAHGRLGKRNPQERRDEEARSRRCPALHGKSTAVPRIASGDQHRWAALPTVPQCTNWVTAKSARPDAARPTGSRTAPAVPTTRSGLSFGSDNCRRYKNPPRSTPTSTTRFSQERHLGDRQNYKERRSITLSEWQSLIGKAVAVLARDPSCEDEFAAP